MGKYKTYEEYKPSGVEWLEPIPQGWDIAPLKRYSEYIQRGLSPKYVDDES
jgi:type I restriction enzyme S subunit